ncbi:DUF3298 domain-containing protein [Aquimarina sp. 2201CG5-10]|uniref:DUF3298 domain-containing protein n=1 Tax=Aquimarina callyspongiae TaxID=3098150 RepID=UPI002AB5910D|nr:DUF3298 domain-containing protein [Aquimarina sp. 2201CG5-10]MDY8134943.1 DUF3298 domain-containing protein [Aquimarina sp. 2201CG5-10]
MKIKAFFLVFLGMIACKNERLQEGNFNIVQKETNDKINQEIKDTLSIFSEENLELDQEKTKSNKRKRLIEAEDDIIELQELVTTKTFYKEEEQYILNYRYPYFSEKKNSSYSIFNDYIKDNYLNIEKTENQILEDKELICDTLKSKEYRDKRSIDYKIYTIKNHFISVLFYTENHYSKTQQTSYTFDCLNFNLKNHRFISYNDFFENDSEKELLAIINRIINNAINSGELYYDCWELSTHDFKVYKSNFVIYDNTIEFYFDDCIICPSYTGTYSVEVPIKDIKHIIRGSTYLL